MRERGAFENTQTPIVPLPDVLATDFVRDHEKFIHHARNIQITTDEKLYCVFQRPEHILGVGDVITRLDYKHCRNKDTGDFDEHHFEYLEFLYIFPEQEHPLAEMHLRRDGETSFVLNHRYVSTEFRGKFGLGARLFQQTEDFVRQIANEKAADIDIQMQIGQKSVIEWAEKMGFSVIPEHQELLEELRDHPERFVEDEVFVSPESQSL